MKKAVVKTTAFFCVGNDADPFLQKKGPHPQKNFKKGRGMEGEGFHLSLRDNVSF